MNTLSDAGVVFRHMDERLSKFEDKISQEVKTMLGCIADEMREFKDALNYFSGTCDDLRKENKAMNNQIEVLKKEVPTIRAAILIMIVLVILSGSVM